MKKLLLVIVLLISFIVNAQEDKIVTLTVSGTGKTLEEAKTNALRSAIEQAFGAFISSKTEILNDNLVKDEIVSVSNGNIQKFDVISQVEIPNNGYAMTLNATVSISKLTSFAESKGIAVEFKGGLFAQNIKLQKLNEDAEEKATKNLIEVYIQLLENSFDYTLESSEPVLVQGKSDTYEIKFLVKTIENENYNNFIKYFKETLSKVQANEEEVSNILKVGKPIYPLVVDSEVFNFRSINAFKNISKFFISSQLLSISYRLTSNLELYKFPLRKLFVRDIVQHFRQNLVLLNCKGYRSAKSHFDNPHTNFVAALYPFYLNNNENYNSYSDLYKLEICSTLHRDYLEEDKKLFEKFYNGKNFSVDKGKHICVIHEKLIFQTTFNAPEYNYAFYFKLSELEKIDEFKITKIPFLEYMNNISNYIDIE